MDDSVHAFHVGEHDRRPSPPATSTEQRRNTPRENKRFHHALQRGIKWHRRVKPVNFLINEDGTLKITDFRLALWVEAAWKENTDSVVTKKDGGSLGLSPLEAGGMRVCGNNKPKAAEIAAKILETKSRNGLESE